MKTFPPSAIKNIAILGHNNAGKSTLADALLFAAGKIDRIGRNEESTLTLDFDAEEKTRHVSVSTAVASLEVGEIKLNLLDTPGLFDFAGGVREALAAADSSLIVLSGKSGLTVGAELAYNLATKQGKAVAFFINKLDSPHAAYRKVLSALTGKYGAKICPIIAPITYEDKVFCYFDLIHNNAFQYKDGAAVSCDLPADGKIQHLRELMLEVLAATDETLMEKFFEGEPFTEREIYEGLEKGMATGELYPVFCGVSQTGEAVPFLLETLAQIAPAASIAPVKAATGDETVTLQCESGAPLAAQVFKTVADPFVGKLNYFKVYAGHLASGDTILNPRTGTEERITKVMLPMGGKQLDVDQVTAGDIGCVAKIASLRTGDTLCDPAHPVTLPLIAFPKPCHSVAVLPQRKGDEEKIAAGLLRMTEEDPTLSFSTNAETRQQILSGLGEQHIDVVLSRLQSKFGVSADLATPKVPYRETIRGKAKAQGRHKKQSGGHGQFGDVWIEFEPCDSDDLVFEEKVFGGAVPKNFFPAVEKGLRDCVQKGVMAGYPMVGIKATLVDGSYHPVDSSEMSFKMAAALAFKAAIPQAKPTLLEPIGTLNVTVQDDAMGDVIGDINKRRGRVLGMEPAEDGQQILAEVPMGEMADFSTAMRSITSGRSVFTLEFARYEEAPPQVVQAVLAEAQAEG